MRQDEQVQLSREELRAAVARAKRGDKRAEDLVIRAVLGFIWQIAHECAPASDSVDVGELVNEAAIGVIRHGIKKFEPRRGLSFLTYASTWIRSYIQRYIALNETQFGGSLRQKTQVASGTLRRERDMLEKMGLSREEAAIEIAARHHWSKKTAAAIGSLQRGAVSSLDAPVHRTTDWESPLIESIASPDPGPEAAFLQAESDRLVRAAVDRLQLKGREKAIVERRLMASAEDQLTLDELGEEIGVSGERARQLEERLLGRLRTSFAIVSRKGAARHAKRRGGGQ